MPSRISFGETTEELFKNLSSAPYDQSCLIIHQIKQKQCFHYERYLSRFSGKGIVVRDIKKRDVHHFEKYDFINDGSIHGKCTLTNVLHLAYFLRYKQIVFVGIDLYDSRYFWLKKARHSIEKKGLKVSSKHPARKFIMLAVRRFKKKNRDIRMYVYNPCSILKKAMPVWDKTK